MAKKNMDNVEGACYHENRTTTRRDVTMSITQELYTHAKKRIPGGVQLLSENPKYPPMIFTYPEHDSIRILGRAVSFLSAVR